MSGKGGSRSSSTEETYTNTNFWGIDGYKNTVKRLEDGALLCDEFMKMINERAEIEMKYTVKLRDWSKRWRERINGKISEYGTMLEGFRSTLREAEEVAEIHVERHNRLKADLCESIKQWKNQHYHKAVLKWKEVKECEAGFSKIYEPWSRKYHKMDKSKKVFHKVSKNSELASLDASNAEKQGNMPEKIKKLNDHSEKLKGELDVARKKYERRLTEINSGNSAYAEQLEEEFTKWEKFEMVRLTFFKDALQRYHNVLDLSHNERLTNTYQSLLDKIQAADSTKDLKFWSAKYGPGMPEKWPEFEAPKEWTLPRNAFTRRQSFMKRMSLRRHNSKKRRKKPVVQAATEVDFGSESGKHRQGSFEALDTKSDDSFSGSADFDWGGDDVSPNNNDGQETGEHSRSSYYQSPSNSRQLSAFYDTQYQSSTVIDDYDHSWNRSSTFGSQSQASCDRPNYQHPVVISCYSSGPNDNSNEYDPNRSPNAKALTNTDEMDHEVEDTNFDTAAKVDSGNNPFAELAPPAGSSNNPFDEPDTVEDRSGYAAVDHVNGQVKENSMPGNVEDVPGIPVRAKYDYDASEEDELSFRVGDIITQVSGEDGQGWCKGKLNGVEGLFPAKWVESV